MTSNTSPSSPQGLIREIEGALGAAPEAASSIDIVGHGNLPSVFAVSDLATASIASAGLAVAELVASTGTNAPAVQVDRRLASMWFASSIRPVGWAVPPPWDPIAGDYRTQDGWIRLHTNAPHHRAAALAVLNAPAEKDAVAKAVAAWPSDVLEEAVVAQGGCAAAMRSLAQWRRHPQGMAVAAEPLFHVAVGPLTTTRPDGCLDTHRPLSGVRALDLTRVLAGPVATRLLAGLGADVLRIDPPDWDEPGVVPEVTLGKRCARLDLRAEDGRSTFRQLLKQADILVHGYRPGALARLGLDAAGRQAIRPGLIDISLDAYGWSGPWTGRRGFDSLVQMSAGIAEAGMQRLRREQPTPLPVQALDHATGYLLAAAAIRGLTRRRTTGAGTEARTSLARVALLLGNGAAAPSDDALRPEDTSDLNESVETTSWGPAHRLRAPLAVEGVSIGWDRPAVSLGSARPAW